jgi:hypothetical protein
MPADPSEPLPGPPGLTPPPLTLPPSLPPCPPLAAQPPKSSQVDVVLQLGSSISIGAPARDPGSGRVIANSSLSSGGVADRALFAFHGVYSRVLLLHTGAILKWRDVLG